MTKLTKCTEDANEIVQLLGDLCMHIAELVSMVLAGFCGLPN